VLRAIQWEKRAQSAFFTLQTPKGAHKSWFFRYKVPWYKVLWYKVPWYKVPRHEVPKNLQVQQAPSGPRAPGRGG
jgi:hypothetical protein